MTYPGIVLLETQRLDDTPAGGGQMTRNIVPDNEANNLFAPISDVNRANGNVSIRKAIAKSLANTTKRFLGARAEIVAPPTNSAVSVLMFYTGSWFDVRSQIVDQIESYLVQGPQTRMWAFGQQVKGQRAVLVYQPVGVALPNIGETYVMVQQNVTPNVAQFVRVKTITNKVETFTDGEGPFQLNVITLGITSPLLSTFPGAEPQRFSTPPPPTVLCTTNVANAASYYGVTKPAVDFAAGDENGKVTSVFGQLLPSTQFPSPISGAQPAGRQAMIASGATTAITLFDWTQVAGEKIYIGRGVYPGTLVVDRDGGGWHYTDDGAGNLKNLAGDVVASIDYPNAAITVIAGGTTFAANYMTLTFTPAVQVTQAGFTKQQPVTQSTRDFVYVDSLHPIPGPGTVVASYRANGRWYDLQDDGTGTLVGPEGAGTGTIRLDTGGVILSAAALPDVPSNVIFSWAQSAQYNIRIADADIQIPAVSFQLSLPSKPSTIVLTYVVAGVTKTITDNGSGVLSGDGSGNVVYGNSILTFRPTALPDPATGFAVAYDNNPQSVQHLTPSKSGGTITGSCGHAIAPGSFLMAFSQPSPNIYPRMFSGSPNIPRVVYDDGVGHLVDTVYGLIIGATLDYSTGDWELNPDLSTILDTPVYENQQQQVWASGSFGGTPPAPITVTVRVITGWAPSIVTAAFIDGSAVTVSSTAAGASSSAQSENFAVPGIKVDLTPKTVEPIVPGSIMFRYAGDIYIDRAGLLYRSINRRTGSGISAGIVDYTTGKGTITDWPAGGAQTLTIDALLAERGVTPIAFLASRVPGQQVRPASFIIEANRKSDGALITASADVNGDFATDDMEGKILVDTGFYSVRFGKSVLDTSFDWSSGATYATGDLKRKSGVFYTSLSDGNIGNDPATDAGVHWAVTPQPWYDSGNIDGTGHIWWPDEALAGTVRYSCVVDTYLPLRADVLGVDPVRLPSDGRVQVFQASNTLAFRHPLTYTFIDDTLSAGQVVALPRDTLQSVVLFDQTGKQVDIGLWSADLAAGSVTMSDPLDLTGYTQPLVARHTRGELVLCTDAQITGELEWSPALQFDYPAATSTVSSCLIPENAGDLEATYDTLFAQTTWNFNPDKLWSDQVQGSSPAAQYNDADFPIQVLDRDCITQRVMLHFTSYNSGTGVWSGDIIFEEKGVVGTFDTAHDVMPINPATSGGTAATTADFTIAAAGSTQVIAIDSAAQLEVADFVNATDGTHVFKGYVEAIDTGLLTATVRTLQITTGAVGNTMTSGAQLLVQNPFFYMPRGGFGGGWAVGNALRANFHGCGFPVIYIRSVQVGALATASDDFETEIGWNE
jgi:hypothetical protein